MVHLRADVKLAGAAIAAECPGLPRARASRHRYVVHQTDGRVRRARSGRCGGVQVSADWNHWQIGDWPAKLREIQGVTDLPGGSRKWACRRVGAEEVQDWGLRRTAELLSGRADRIHCTASLTCRGPAATAGTVRRRVGLLSALLSGAAREEAPQAAYKTFADARRLGSASGSTPTTTPRAAVEHMQSSRTIFGRLSWADSFRPNALEWFDRRCRRWKLHRDVTFASRLSTAGSPDHTSRPQCPDEYADFCAAMVRRYARTCPKPRRSRAHPPGLMQEG